MARQLEDIIQGCIERLRHGASVEELLLGYPDEAPLIEPALRSAQAALALPRSVPSRVAFDAAMQRMLGELSAAPATARPAWLAAFLQRPRAFQAAALAGGIGLFSVAGIGAAAATGGGPEPVREFFGLSDSQVKIEFEGTVVSVEPGESTLDVSAGGAIRTVMVDASTELSEGGDEIALTDIAAGDVVEVKGTLQADGTVLATRVHLEDAEDEDEDEDEDERKDNNSGPGNSDDDAGDENGDGDEEDNSGPGNQNDGEDEDEDEDTSGPGNAHDDNEDRSGPPDRRGASDDDDAEHGQEGGDDDDEDEGDDD